MASVFWLWAAAQATGCGSSGRVATLGSDWAPYLGQDGPGAEYVRTLDEARRARLEDAVKAAYLDGEADGPRSYAALAYAVKGRVQP